MTQLEVQRLVEDLSYVAKYSDSEHWSTLAEVVAELRRLHAQRDALLEALRECATHTRRSTLDPTDIVPTAGAMIARAAIKAAEENTWQEPPCATRECMPSQCPNCASLEAQNTELDRKLADLEQTSLELCETCGWRTLIPGDCCLNCERHPLGQASTDVPLTVYSVKVKKAEPGQDHFPDITKMVQEPVAWMVYTLDGKSVCVTDNPADFIEWRSLPLYTAPPQRKPLTIKEINALPEAKGYWPMGMNDRIVRLIRAVERAHGIT